jgi:hypothetical protein
LSGLSGDGGIRILTISAITGIMIIGFREPVGLASIASSPSAARSTGGVSPVGVSPVGGTIGVAASVGLTIGVAAAIRIPIVRTVTVGILRTVPVIRPLRIPRTAFVPPRLVVRMAVHFEGDSGMGYW